MNFLLINSNDKDAFVALTQNENLYISNSSDFTESNATKKPDKLINCLYKISKEHNLKNIDTISVTIGPGSFTGIRVGLSIAKGIAFGLNKKIVPINNFQLILNMMRNISNNKSYCVLIPAKLPEYYYSVIKNGKEIKSGCIEIENLDKIAEKDTIIVSDFDDENIIKHSYFEFINIKKLKKTVDSMIELTKKLFSNGYTESAENVEPLYLKDFIVKQPISNS